ncbi:MAG TPA: ABC transporter ATP-binding protein [Anaerolineae bacterium]|nr:ABC transporter ATP-binding protein [Anaerolineae bacterium]HQK13763.1 ABC transporter ATP-binding protein [Anaerolineae bacterium]
MNTAILSFRNVSFGYQPSQPVLQDVNFDLRPGRIAAILGPNGAGKTTLLFLALGWLTAWTGEVTLNGRPLKALSPRERGRMMALVPQSEYTPFDYTVLEYVLMGRAPHLLPLGMPSVGDTDIALNALEQVGIRHLAGRAVPRISGGERQLMLLARALTQLAASPDPTTRLLLLDEPTAHLDLRNKARIIEIMRRLRDTGATLLMTNHEPDVVLAVADDVLLLEPALPPQFGALEQVFTAEALSRVYQLPIRLVQVDGHKQVLWT